VFGIVFARLLLGFRRYSEVCGVLFGVAVVGFGRVRTSSDEFGRVRTSSDEFGRVGSGSRVQGLGFRVEGLGFRVLGFGFRV
jgi:hypothetical protein